LFLNYEKLGTVTAVYLPFIAIFMAWFTASANLLFYMLFSKTKDNGSSFDLTMYSKHVYNFISFFAFAAAATFICEFSLRQSISTTLADITHPNIIFNILVLCGIYLCLISIIGKGISNILITIITIFLTVANYIKFTYFDEPFYPWDMYLIKNLIGISKEYLNFTVILAVVIVFIFAILLIIRFRHKIGSYLKPKVSFILMPFAAVLFIINAHVLINYSISSQIGIEKSWYIGKTEILSNGMFAQNYFYLEDLDKYLNPKPEGYSEDSMLAINQKYANTSDQTTSASTANLNEKPNVVVIMSESYWDITKLSGIELSEDVAKNVHKYQKGEIASPAIGGGTANTEFEALSGLSMYFMSPGIIAYNAYLRTETPSIASVFKNNGYKTTAIHPNSGWFYNRDKVYNYFGFDTFLDISSFNPDTQTKGTHVSDDALVNKVLQTLNSSSEPSFIFAVSMENHDPFTDKYDNFEVTAKSDKLNASELDIINGYAQGLYDADKSLGKLIDALSKSDKPTLLYFFGDHAPRLGTLDDYYRIYDKLATVNEQEKKQGIGELKYYTTPVVTWSNYKEMKSLSSIVSPTHIGYEILKDSGVDYPNYFNILSELETTYPIMHLKGTSLVDPNSELVKDYKLIQYDLLFGKQYLSKMN
jgi:phosphoglycerol transferase MdoB-like AlkP superfamily enzyme